MITKEILKKIAPTAKDSIIEPLAKYLNIHMPTYGVNTQLRIEHFLAQAAHESAGFRTLEEYASGAAYEGRVKDLGNTQKGDGVRFKGRGIFQLTGRANYTEMGKKLGVDLVGNPDLAETPEISVLTALEYWKSRGLSALADNDDVTNITKKINGGLNGFDDRKAYLARAKAAIPSNFSFSGAVNTPKALAARGDKGDYVKSIQKALITKGYSITADGDFGPNTENAVKAFQKESNLPITGVIDTATATQLMLP